MLEKPGAATLAELEDMASLAKANEGRGFMGYNKNVSKYVEEARAFEANCDGDATPTIWHNNDFVQEALPECFERNNEGMIKNMLIHELAMIVTYWGVSVTTIKEVVPD